MEAHAFWLGWHLISLGFEILPCQISYQLVMEMTTIMSFAKVADVYKYYDVTKL